MSETGQSVATTERGAPVIKNRRAGWGWASMGLVSAVVALATVGASLATAQNPPAKKVAPKAKGKNTAQKKAPPNAADPLADKAAKIDPVSYHFKLKLHSFDDTPLVAAYYRAAKLDQTAPVVMLVHEKERSSKDFQDSIADLKGLGLAEYLQANGFAVLTFDLRGHGANPRKAMTERDWQSMVNDVQAAYQFLVDRHNRGELNIAKLGVLGLGEGANLVTAWAEQPGGAVSSEGRTADIGSMRPRLADAVGLGLCVPQGDGLARAEVPGAAGCG